MSHRVNRVKKNTKLDPPCGNQNEGFRLYREHPGAFSITVFMLQYLQFSLDHSIVEPLIRAFKDESEMVRNAAVFALGYIGDPRAVDALIRALNDESGSVSSAAGDALGKIKNPRAIGPLIHALGDEEIIVRWNAEVVLERITGQDYGKDIGKWKEWWEENKEGF